jgi:hypothetical protein
MTGRREFHLRSRVFIAGIAAEVGDLRGVGGVECDERAATALDRARSFQRCVAWSRPMAREL